MALPSAISSSSILGLSSDCSSLPQCLNGLSNGDECSAVHYVALAKLIHIRDLPLPIVQTAPFLSLPLTPIVSLRD